MRQLVSGILIFYRKLVAPTLIFSALVGLFGFPMSGRYSFLGLGVGYMLFAPFFHYFIYDIRNSNEYFFYHNMGLSRAALWVASVIISITIGITLAAL